MEKTKIYDHLLSDKRERKSTIQRPGITVEAESDRGRVLFCPSFRRLQQKAQVFSLESNAAVRSRLTHSLEVAQIGRLLAELIAERLVEKDLMSAELRQAFMTFVETACLMHDIGNPPFGHFGEEAIRSWFVENGDNALRQAMALDEVAAKSDRARDSLKDFLNFDGNPQGLRIVAKLQGLKDDKGLNLTHTSLASFIKYVRCSDESDGGGPFRKKAGYFRSERALIDSINRTFAFGSSQRFPLAYIMEASDDIAYCVSDLEDSIEKGLIEWKSAFSEIERGFLARFKGSCAHPSFSKIKKILRVAIEDGALNCDFVAFRTSLNWVLAYDVVDCFVRSHDEILDGMLPTLLPKDEPSGAILDELRTYCRKYVYPHESVQKVELAGYAAIRGLLDQFKPLLVATSAQFRFALNGQDIEKASKPMVIEKKMLSLFPQKHKNIYLQSDSSDGFAEWEARAHLVVDYVSGMTDDFAVSTYRMLSGTKL